MLVRFFPGNKTFNKPPYYVTFSYVKVPVKRKIATCSVCKACGTREILVCKRYNEVEERFCQNKHVCDDVNNSRSTSVL